MDKLDFINNFIDDNKDYFIAIANKIWEYAELPYREFKSSRLLIDELKKWGFEVEENVAGIKTAFIAKSGESGPKFGFLGEYDALDTLSQEAANPKKCPIKEGSPGHGCGHNLLGAGSLAAALACKAYLEENNIKGQVYYFGCAAEEDSGAKTFMARDGVFDDMDFVYTWHPSDVNMVESVRSVAIMSANFSFQGRSAHAGGSPWLGRSALDAAEIMSVGANYLREHMLDQERIHYAYLDAGGTAANVVQDRAVVKYEVRSPKLGDLNKLFARLVKCAEGASHMTETKVDYEITMVFADYIPNSVLGPVADSALKEVGPPNWSEQDYELAREFLMSYDKNTKESVKEFLEESYGFDQVQEKLKRPLDDRIHDFIPNYTVYNSGSTDVGNVCYRCPTISLSIASWCLGNVGHTWQTTGQTASSLGEKALITAGKAMALGALRMLEMPELIEEAKAYVSRQRGDSYKEPLPSYLKPPIFEEK